MNGRILGVLVLTCLGFAASDAAAWDETIFTHDPDGNVVNGELGVVRPSYDTRSLFAAYCWLIGKQPGAQPSAVRAGDNTANQLAEQGNHLETGVERWLAARAAAAGAPTQVTAIQTERELKVDRGWLQSYLNCDDDAFDTAARTLADRVKVLGSQSPEVQAWILAQDEVFANCPGGEHLPADAAGSSSPLVRADRAYQIAAAHFYAGQFDEAKAHFDAIEQDASSPWSHLAPYLSARALFRKATLIPEEGFDRTIMTQAETQLQRVLDDQSRIDLRPAAQRLMDKVRNRLHPAARARELVERWMGHETSGTADEMREYIMLVHRDRVEHPDEFTDWLQTFHDDFPWLDRNETRPANEQIAFDHALARWQATGSLPWLIAVLTNIPTAHPSTFAVMESAAKVPPNSPGFLTVSFHLARLLAESGHDAEARERLNLVLEDDGRQLPRSTRNLVFALRMNLAQNFDEFLRYAPRLPVDRYEGMGHSENIEAAGVNDPPELDSDSTWVFNEQLPLAELFKAASSDRLPGGVRRNVTVAAWVRAVVLGQRKAVDKWLAVVSPLLPKVQPQFDAYRAAKTDDERRFALALILLKTPGLTYQVEQGLGRGRPLNQLAHVWAINWWCTVPPGQRYRYWLSRRSRALKTLYKADAPPKFEFISNAERDTFLAEQRQLDEAGSGPTYVGRAVLLQAKKHPADPRVPEALHAVVDAGHWACGDADTAQISKTAFRLLHKRYPNTEWAKKTPYWYGSVR